MNKVNIFCSARKEGKYLLRGNCFENALLEELEESKKYLPDNEHNGYKILFDEIEGKGYPEDTLLTLFEENVNIDFEFAKQLKLYDIITVNCFYSDTEIGKALICLIGDFTEFRFILYERSWVETNEIEISFEVADCDNGREVQIMLIKGEFDAE